MAHPRLRTVLAGQGCVRALRDGTVAPRGFEFEFVEVPVLVDAFRRMVRGLEFDVCEMAITTYLCARDHGKGFTALPVFVQRGRHHGMICYNTRSGVRHPKDLEGRRVGVNRGYTVTTGVWVRAILQEEYGLDLDRVTWVRSGDEHVTEVDLPDNVETMDPAHTLRELLIAGELAAVVGVKIDHPDVRPLIPDATRAAESAFRTRGFHPINHLVVVRDDRLAAHPDLATALVEAFATAKDRYLADLRSGAIGDPTETDDRNARILAITGGDPLPYGVPANRAMIDELVGHAVRQGILDKRMTPDDLFVTTGGS
ncbi:ABC transporter substrate-binding protein [Actinophytocola sp.]|uniref:ABC transporter substrate-binding protein n=1 Tax=Actinophytocola sp. TaxID=1872138 RepID=UPI003D6C0B96